MSCILLLSYLSGTIASCTEEHKDLQEWRHDIRECPLKCRIHKLWNTGCLQSIYRKEKSMTT